jgi:hypothetical protein
LQISDCRLNRWHSYAIEYVLKAKQVTWNGTGKRLEIKTPQAISDLQSLISELDSQFSISLERCSMRSHLAIVLILGGIITLLWSIGLAPQPTVSLAQPQPPPRPTLTAAPPTPIPPTAPPATATPRPRSDDDDDPATPTATPTLTPDAIATPTAEPTAISTPTAPTPTAVAPAGPPQLPKTGDSIPTHWPMALVGLALIALGLRLFRAAGSMRGRA